MKKSWIAWVLMLMAATALGGPVAHPHEDSPLEIVLSHPGSKQEAESGIIVFTLKNRSQKPIHILQALSPFTSSSERVINNLFSVTDGNGKEVKYTGIFASGPDDAKALLTINPGEALTKRINLAETYDFGSGGAFKVMFSRDLIRDLAIDDKGERSAKRSHPYHPQHSNVLDIWINAAFLKARTAMLP